MTGKGEYLLLADDFELKGQKFKYADLIEFAVKKMDAAKKWEEEFQATMFKNWKIEIL